MSKIKTRETVKDIKVLDKAAVAGERMKDAFIRTKDTVQNLSDDGQVRPNMRRTRFNTRRRMSRRTPDAPFPPAQRKR